MGEQRTGISRSEAFIVGQSFHYFAAGHIGVPGAKIEAFNFVRLRDAKTHEILFERTPPRNDVAQKQVWDTTKHAGKSVLVELTDGDSRGAYAWLAVGRFSVEGLNPDRSAEDRRQGAQVVGAFGLTELAPSLKELLVQQANDRDTAAALAESLVQLKFDSRLSAVVETFKTVGASPQLRDQAAKCVAQGNFYLVETVLKDTLKVATSAEQLRMAERLASDEAGAGSLATLGENGHLTPSLLTRPTVQPKLAAIKNADLKKRLDALIASAPPEDAKIEALIKAKKAELTATPGNAELGAALFKKSCAICHQVGGQGAMIGANLDGIGNRGLERLLEDVLAPNRNVDIAFRTTTIVTKSGRVLSGLIKPSEGKELLLIDNQGKPQMIPLDEIEERLPSKLSLMPANFVEQVPPEDFRNLIAYLLTLRGS